MTQLPHFFVLVEAISAALCLAVAMNALSRRGGLAGIRGMLALSALSAAVGCFALLGASLQSDPSDVIRWHAALRASLAGIATGAVGAALTLVRPNDRRGLRWVLFGGLLAATLGAVIALSSSPDEFVRTPVSWFPTSLAVRWFDTVAIVLASISVTAAALHRLRGGSRYGRRTLWALVGVQAVVAVSYFVVRVWAPPALMQAFGISLTALSAVLFWFVLHDWRVAGVGHSAYTLLFRTTPRPVVLVDLHTQSFLQNAAAIALLGRARTTAEILTPLGVEAPMEQFLAEHAGRSMREKTLDGALGQVFDVHVHFDVEEGLGLLQFDDVTERVEHARTLERTFAERQAMQERLVINEKMAALGVLVAGVSHEINNPLAYANSGVGVARDAMTVLLEGAALAREAVATSTLEALRAWTQRQELRLAEEDGLAALADAADGCARIKHLVSSMRLFTRQEETEVTESFAEIARAGLHIGRVSLKAGVKLVTGFDDELPVRGLPGELTRVVTNLIVNAGQAVGEHGTITLRVFGAGDRAVLEVSDDGPGVSPALRQRIFEPFFTTKAPGAGTGLGLAICFEIARRHGGDLVLVDRPGPGACFQLRLPRATNEKVVAPLLQKASGASGSGGPPETQAA